MMKSKKNLPITKKENGLENLKKMEMLTEKLGNYFKNRLATLMEEKNYKYSQLILDIGSFWRTMDGFGVETDSIVPKMEKYLTNILSKIKTENNRYDIESNINTSKYNGNISVKNSTRKPLDFIDNENDQKNYNRNFTYNTAEKIKGNSVKSLKSVGLNQQLMNKINPSTVGSTKNYIPTDKSNTLDMLSNTPNNYLDSQSQELKNLSLRSASENPTDIFKNRSVVLTQKTDRLNNLKERASDEWAMIIKYNHLKHLEDEQNKRSKIEEKKKLVKETLENQMKEKDNLKRIKQEEDKKFFNIQSQNLISIQQEDLEKNRKKAEQIKVQKEMQEKLIKESMELKNDVRLKEKNIDKKILDKLKMDMMNEEEKLHNKKSNERNMYKNIIKENEVKAEMKKKKKEEEKLENKKALDDYTNLIEKQEKERLRHLESKIVRHTNNFEAENIRAIENKEYIKLYEEQKFIKEKEELDKRQKFRDDKAKYYKQRQIDDIKMTLKNQIDEKNRMKKENMKFDNIYNEVVKSNVEKYVLEKENKVKSSQERVIIYKDSLDKQITEKEKKKVFMDEKEKQFNKELIGKIYSEFNVSDTQDIEFD